MFQAFMVILREGVEAFLIVAIVFAYLRKTSQEHLLPSVNWGIAASVLLSGLLGYVLWIYQGINQPLLEGIFALVTAFLVGGLVIHMWRIGPQFKQIMEKKLSQAAAKPGLRASAWGVFLFTVFMITREGMEMMLLLFQIRDPRMIFGIFLGVAGAVLFSFVWEQFSYLVNLRSFFKITAVYFLLFTLQILFQAFHEFTEAGIFPISEFLHEASEILSSDSFYGKLYNTLTLAGCGLWLMGSLISERFTTHSQGKTLSS
jgi:high-affinity iron transporter